MGDIPVHYRNALSDLFLIRYSDERYFLCRIFINENPIVFILTAEKLSEAYECAFVIKNIATALISDYDKNVFDMLQHRAYFLSHDHAKHLLNEIGIFVNYSSNHDEIDVIPYNETTGFVSMGFLEKTPHAY